MNGKHKIQFCFVLTCVCNITVRTCIKSQEIKKYFRSNTHQILVLEAAFFQNPFLNQATLKQLVQQTDLKKTIHVIRTWFLHKRRNISERIKKRKLSKGEGTKTNKNIS